MPKMEDRRGTDSVVCRVVITHHENGSLSVEGPIAHKEYLLSILENAKDVVRNSRGHDRPIIVPKYDVSLEAPIVPLKPTSPG